MARSASDIGVAAQIEGLMAEALLPEEILLVGGLLDALAEHGFADADEAARTEMVHGFSAQDDEAKLGLLQLKALTLLFFYALPDEAGPNPNWEAIGYPGPNSPPPSPARAPRRRSQSRRSQGPRHAVGRRVRDRLGRRRRSDRRRVRRRRQVGARARDGRLSQRVGLQAARAPRLSRALLRRRARRHGVRIDRDPGRPDRRRRDRRELHELRAHARPILAEWAGHGLEGLDDDAFVRDHMEVVLERIGANTEATTQNGTHRRLMAACDELGYEHRPIWRNAALHDDAEFCGYCPMGCQQGCKRSAMKTWLQDASDAGGRCVPGCHADRILIADGRATGVAATVTHADGSTTALTVEAPTVVVACGSIESPALLLRSGIGGPAAGKHLRLHPAFVVMGIYDEPVEGWRGQVQSLLSDHFFDIEDGCGFLIEATGLFPALLGASYPWESAPPAQAADAVAALAGAVHHRGA